MQIYKKNGNQYLFLQQLENHTIVEMQNFASLFFL